MILALRIICGGDVGTDYIHEWIRLPQYLDTPCIYTWPLANHLKSRHETTKLFHDQTTSLKEIVCSIYNLKDSFYQLSFRRYGTAQYNLDYRFGGAILDCVIALECLFGPKTKAIPRILEITKAKHKALSWTLKYDFPQEIQGLQFTTLLKKIWRVRDKIAHGKSSVDATEEVKMEIFWLLRVALLFLRYSLLRAAELDFPEREVLHQLLDGEKEEPEEKFEWIEVPNHSGESKFWLEYNGVRRDLFGYLKKEFTEINWKDMPVKLNEIMDEIGTGLIEIWERIKSHYSSEKRKVERLSGAFYEALFYYACLKENIVLVEAQQLKHEGLGENLPPGEVPYSATMPIFEVIPRLFWLKKGNVEKRYAPQIRGDFVQFRRGIDDTAATFVVDVKRSNPKGTQSWESYASILGGAVYEIAYPKDGVDIPLKMEDWEREIVCLNCGKWPIKDGICAKCGKNWNLT